VAGFFVLVALFYLAVIGVLLSLGGFILGYFFRMGWDRAGGPPT
jgi:hypothetical protein